MNKLISNLKLIIDKYPDILCVAETKTDEFFPASQFSFPGYHKHYHLDICYRWGVY